MNDSASLGRLCLALFLVACVAACGNETPTTNDGAGVEAPASHDEHEGHDHDQGPHGGAIAVIGNDVAHLEAEHDLNLGQVMVYVLTTDNVVIPLDEPPVLNLSTDEGTVQVKAVKMDEGWLFEDDVLLDEPEQARFRLAFNGKTYQSDMPCGHEHDHGHDEGHDEDHDHDADHEHDEDHDHDDDHEHDHE